MDAISFAAFLLTACSGGDAALAPSGANAWNDGYPAVTMAVPAGAPSGTLEIASFGLIELTPAEMAPMMMIHVRIAATSSSDRPWRIDLPSATLRAGTTESRTLLANGDLATLPVALVERGQPRTIDLYFAPPLGVRDEGDLAELELRVPIVTQAGTFHARVHFARRAQLVIPSPRAEAVRVAGWGSHWWADPAHAWPMFHRRSGIVTPRPPAHAVVSRVPCWQRTRSTP